MKMGKKKKIILIVAGILLLLVALGIGGMSLQVGKMVAEGLLYQNEGNDTKGNSIKQLELWGYDIEKFEASYDSECMVLEASDGVKVPVTYYANGKEDGAAPIVILIHGAGGDHVSTYPLAEGYLKRGWQVLSYDQRGSGDSSDDKVSFGYYEQLDTDCVVEYAANTLHSSRIVVHGQSMGAATAALYATSQHARDYVEAIILDSPIDSMEHMFRGVWREMEGTEDIPEDYVVACGDWYLKHFYGFSFADADITAHMHLNKVKTLMIQSEKDELCTIEEGKALFDEIAADNKQLCMIDCKHVEGAITNEQEYWNAVFSFLETK